LTAFGLLSLRNGQFDAVALIAGAVVAGYNLLQYNLLRASFKHIDQFVLLAAQFLWSLGIVVIYRIDPDLAIKQFACLLLGSIAMVVMMLLIRKSRDFGRLNWLFMALTLALLASTLVLGRTTYGAKNWIDLGFISVQPSEFAKVLFIAVSAYFLSTRHRLVSFIPYLGFTALCVVLLVVEKDLGAGLLIGMTFLIMFFAATGRTWLTLAGVGVLGVGAFGSYHLFSHVRTRVEVWQDPWSSYQDQGYQIVQGLMALASGGLLGVGLGQGMPSVIPARHTDYIFTVIAEEFGIIVGIMVIVFYLVFVIRGVLIALDAKSTYDALLVFGCTAMLALQTFIIIGGVIKLIPLTGITMPFVSYGGSSILSSMIQLGIIEGVAVKNGKADEEALHLMGGELE
ncbi:MAG: FtsW/RodA/SpoVE family cell cycle protein, partial [Christensenellaceae bacterium]|nr:FtsW/RodA/SpoVE family cell cycle protein [Christensenellaceae bacterium]